MITKRLRLYDEATCWRFGHHIERLVVIDWIAAVQAVEADHWNKSYTEDDRIHQVRGIQITWAPTGTAEIVGWVENAEQADAIIRELEVLLEMAGPLS